MSGFTASDIKKCGRYRTGSIVRVRDERERVVGKAFYSSKSQIALASFAAMTRKSTQSSFGRKPRRRRYLSSQDRCRSNLSRRVFSEGDLLPGLIVDRYGEYLVIQSLIQSTDRLQPH
jgi:23S rRNA (cytosine1962-C5)-methyltransferase